MGQPAEKTVTSSFGRARGDGTVKILQPTLVTLDRLLAWVVERERPITDWVGATRRG